MPGSSLPAASDAWNSIRKPGKTTYYAAKAGLVDLPQSAAGRQRYPRYMCETEIIAHRLQSFAELHRDIAAQCGDRAAAAEFSALAQECIQKAARFASHGTAEEGLLTDKRKGRVDGRGLFKRRGRGWGVRGRPGARVTSHLQNTEKAESFRRRGPA